VWYNLRVVIDPAAKSATCYVNDIERGRVAVAAGAQVAQMRVTAPEAVGGQCWADELVVRPHLPYPADYAPEPVPVATGSNIVMMQSCDLWREGLHNGYGSRGCMPLEVKSMTWRWVGERGREAFFPDRPKLAMPSPP
jgi:hypothetical protein